jgi:hypothetical protein
MPPVSRISRWARNTGMAVSAITNTATALGGSNPG